MIKLEEAIRIKSGDTLIFEPTIESENEERAYENQGFHQGDKCTVLEPIPLDENNICFRVVSQRTKKVQEYHYLFFTKNIN